MKYRLILLLASLITLSSCSKDDNDSNLKDLIVGTWYYDTKVLRPTYYYMVFNEDGTGVEGVYYAPDPEDSSNTRIPFRYAIMDGKIGRCYDETHTHPIKPGESCPPDKVVFDPLHVDKNTLRIDAWSSGNITYTRYAK